MENQRFDTRIFIIMLLIIAVIMFLCSCDVRYIYEESTNPYFLIAEMLFEYELLENL